MSKQNQAVETKTDKQNRLKVAPAVIPKQVPDPAALVNLPPDPTGAAGDGSIEAQAARLSDRRFQPVQRRAMAARIGRVQGNKHLRRVVDLVKSTPGNGAGAAKQGRNSVVSRVVQLSPLSVELEQVLITQGRQAFFSRLSGLNVSDQDVADFVEQTFQGDELRLARRLLHVVPRRNNPRALPRVRLEHLFDLYTTLQRQHEPPELGGNIYDHDWIYSSEGSGHIREIVRSKLRTKLDRPQLQIWFTNYVQELTGPEARKRELLHLVRDVFQSPSWQTTDQIPINPRWSAWKQRCAELWNSKGQLFADLAQALDPGIQPYVAAGIMAAETGQEFFRSGRAIARVEAHVFWRLWGNTSRERRRVFNQHFRRSRPHQWRRNTSDRFQGYHGNQEKEWEVLDFARSLDSLADTKAVEATSFGAGQTMGFNYSRAGFSSALEMLEHYQMRERGQIEGIFNYIATIRPESRKRRVIAAIRQENFLPLSQSYGPQNPQGHAQRIARAVRTIRRLVEGDQRRREAAAEDQAR